MVNRKKWGGRAPPPSPAWANFSIVMECMPESGGCHSVGGTTYFTLQDTPKSTHRVTGAAFWHKFHHDGKNCLGWWEWGVHALPLSLYSPLRTKLQCTLQLRGQIHSPCLVSAPMYSVVYTHHSLIVSLHFSIKWEVKLRRSIDSTSLWQSIGVCVR
jgi:hypothetical protein